MKSVSVENMELDRIESMHSGEVSCLFEKISDLFFALSQHIKLDGQKS